MDLVGDACVVGTTNSPDFPTAQAEQPTVSILGDAFIAKVRSARVSAAPQILRVSPAEGGNTGQVSILIEGSGLQSGATVELVRTGEQPIVAASVVATASAGTLAASLDLAGRTVGAWDVMVTNPDGNSAAAPGAFMIQPGRTPEVWVDILGRSKVRVGTPATFTIVYGNRSNIDARGVPLWIGGIPRDTTLELGFEILPPPPLPDAPQIDWQQVPPTFERGDEVLLPLTCRSFRQGAPGHCGSP